MRRAVLHLMLWPVLAGLAVDAQASTRRRHGTGRDEAPVHAGARDRAPSRAERLRQEREAKREAKREDRREDPCSALSRSKRAACERKAAQAADVELRRDRRPHPRAAAASSAPADPSRIGRPAREVQPEDLIGGLEAPALASPRPSLRGAPGGDVAPAVASTKPAAAAASAPRPRGSAGPTSLREVILEDGQSLDDLAARTGVSVADLARLNGISSPEDVPTGMRLKLPSAASAPARLAAAPAPVAAPPAVVPPPIRSPSRRELASTTPSLGPRPYSSLGPANSAAPLGPGPVPVRRGGRTEADARAAYAVASARAPHLADREDARHDRFAWPVRAEVVSTFGPHGEGRRNDGVDLAARPGDAVRAAAAGEVVYAGREIAGSGGNLVLLKHADGWVTAYSHLGRVVVAMRQTVGQGQEIAESPDVAGASVHFEVRQPGAGGAKPVDPVSVLPARGGGETGRGS